MWIDFTIGHASAKRVVNGSPAAHLHLRRRRCSIHHAHFAVVLAEVIQSLIATPKRLEVTEDKGPLILVNDAVTCEEDAKTGLGLQGIGVYRVFDDAHPCSSSE